MAERASSPGVNGKALTAERPEDIRNVALVGHAGAGKTTLAEALGGHRRADPGRRVEDGTTCLGLRGGRGPPAALGAPRLATVEHAGHRITLLDTPGSPDFVGELRAGLRAADAALFVVSAAVTRRRRRHRAAVGGVRRGGDAARRRRHPGGPARADVEDAVRTCQLLLGGGAARVLPCTCSSAVPTGSRCAGCRCSPSALDDAAGAHDESEATAEADRLRAAG